MMCASFDKNCCGFLSVVDVAFVLRDVCDFECGRDSFYVGIDASWDVIGREG
jgi:hypothetical protein